jgi:hypothetical protein
MRVRTGRFQSDTGVRPVVKNNPRCAPIGNALFMQPAVGQGTLNEAVGTLRPYPFRRRVATWTSSRGIPKVAVRELTAGLADRKFLFVTLIACWDELLRRHQSRPVNHRTDLDRLTMVYDRIVENRATTPGVFLDTEGKAPAEIAAKIVEMGKA